MSALGGDILSFKQASMYTEARKTKKTLGEKAKRPKYNQKPHQTGIPGGAKKMS